MQAHSIPIKAADHQFPCPVIVVGELVLEEYLSLDKWHFTSNSILDECLLRPSIHKLRHGKSIDTLTWAHH